MSPYQGDTYKRTAVVSLGQLTDPPSAVVQSVATDLARGLNLDRAAFPYTDIADMARRLGTRQVAC